MIKRYFKNIDDETIGMADQQSFLVSLGLSQGMTWEKLLLSQRVLIISEAGAGKTYECRSQAERLWAEGEPAFFIELAALATEELRSLLDSDEEDRLDAWRKSQSDVATFFLDSIDELKLTAGSFERALKRLKKAIGNQVHRAKFIITTRPIPFDEQLVRKLLPIPLATSSEFGEETFANIAMGQHQVALNDESNKKPQDWRTVALMPLSDEQIAAFSKEQGVQEPELLLIDLKRRNAQEFARRPQDLIELCVDWREHKRIRTHREQVETNVRVKLLPRDDRAEPAQLSVDKAIEGASRLALAMQVTRRLTIRHSAAADIVVDEAEVALDPAIILSDWQSDERKALLERPLFGFASYGRVRFHHRSVAEYLASERLLVLRKQGMPLLALKRLLFAETKGKIIVRPSKRPVVAWLALKESAIFELLRDNEPTVLMDEGDPESLMQTQRNQALKAYVYFYGSGGWRGLNVPSIQVHRFSTKGLAGEIQSAWEHGVASPDVRDFLLSLIEIGCIEDCAEIAFQVSQNVSAPNIERIIALNALIAIDDSRLSQIAANIACADETWPEKIARSAVISLFPKYMSVKLLCQALGWIKQKKRSATDLNWQLPRLISSSNLEIHILEELCDNLVVLLSEGLIWRKDWPHITSEQAHLSGALATTCLLGLKINNNDKWLHGSVLALRLHHRDHGSDDAFKELQKKLNHLTPSNNERLFWIDDFFLQSLNEVKDPWNRLTNIMYDGPIQLKHERDLSWVKDALCDKGRDLDERAMLLEAANSLSPNRDSWKEHVELLKPLVADEPSLTEKVNTWLRHKPSKEEGRRKKKQAERIKQEERRKAKNLASWILFWRQVANQPEDAFSSDRSWNSAWDLWRAMRNEGDVSRASGWNRRFIEQHFDIETADKLRIILMKIWRDEQPTLPSERAETERNTYLTSWELGLAGLYAEAEDHNWASKLSHSEAQLAARLALTELNGLPQWIEDLIKEHPTAVDQTLGNELLWELSQEPKGQGHSRLLQAIGNAEELVVQLFMPNLELWLNTVDDLNCESENRVGMNERIRKVTNLIVKHGDVEGFDELKVLAVKQLKNKVSKEQSYVWLSTLMKLEPQLAVEKLQELIVVIQPAERSEAIMWLANLFGERRDSIDLDDERFTPKLLLILLRIAYTHVQLKDDAQHEGSYSPDTRDDAERARNKIVTALFNAKGEEGLAAKLEMAHDPLCVHFKDRILAVAEENWAQEVDADSFDEVQAVALDKTGEAPASTNEAMFAILKDRLSDLTNLLLQDASPLEAWGGITEERVMRREIARELSHAANSIYSVDQEAVTAEEKETDIRMRSVVSPKEAVIELKLADKRTARDLLDTIQNQLVKKYMADENKGAGALLITLAKNRKWKSPTDESMIDVHGLMILLKEEAERVQSSLGGNVFLHVHLLDLRARLPLEKDKKLIHKM
jgi:hypothetical protein